MQSTSLVTDSDVDQPPEPSPISPAALVLMNFGFFGIQFSFGLQQTAINPLFVLIGANAHDLPILNLAGPLSGLLIQPMIGALSDKTWSDRWGRRKPYLVGGAIGCSICLFLFPFVGALWTAVLLLWLLDISNNTSMEPYKALLADILPKNQLARGFMTQAMFAGAGLVTANAMIFIFQRLITGNSGGGEGLPYWVYVAFWTGAVCSIGTVLVAMLRTKEIPPTPAQLAEIRSASKGPGAMVGEIREAVREMPVAMHKLGLVYLFQWYAIVLYWQFVAVSLSETAFGGDFEKAVGWTGAMGMVYNGTMIVAALALIPVATKFGAKRVHAACLALMAIAMVSVSQASSPLQALIPMVLFGIGWASMMGVPFILVASMVPKARMGVYIGIVNMMIVVPMLIQNVTFGWIFETFLGSSGSNTLLLSGVLFACGAVAMLWVNPPSADQESDLMPLGTKKITVYDQVVVGTDGTASAMYAVDRAVEVASAAEARLVVISAYDQVRTATADQHREVLVGDAAARRALGASLDHLDASKVRRIDQRVVEGNPARALIDTAAKRPASLIVVGNRGLGAIDGQILGSVPGEVVKNATCDVLIVQTSALDERSL